MNNTTQMTGAQATWFVGAMEERWSGVRCPGSGPLMV